jgi:hypothetical protein
MYQLTIYSWVQNVCVFVFSRAVLVKNMLCITLLFLCEMFKFKLFLPLQEPLYLDKCIVCSEADWEGYFEVQELASKDTYIFKVRCGSGIRYTLRLQEVTHFTLPCVCPHYTLRLQEGAHFTLPCVCPHYSVYLYHSFPVH